MLQCKMLPTLYGLLLLYQPIEPYTHLPLSFCKPTYYIVLIFDIYFFIWWLITLWYIFNMKNMKKSNNNKKNEINNLFNIYLHFHNNDIHQYGVWTGFCIANTNAKPFSFKCIHMNDKIGQTFGFTLKSKGLESNLYKIS